MPVVMLRGSWLWRWVGWVRYDCRGAEGWSVGLLNSGEKVRARQWQL